MEKIQSELLRNTILFRGVEPAVLEELIREAGGYTLPFLPEEEILTSPEGNSRLGILLSGSVTVYSHREHPVLLNRLRQGSLFGVSALYGEQPAATLLLGKEKGEIFFLDAARAEVLWANPTIRKNLISFLADRIRFLNAKIASLTAHGAEGKLLRHLIQQSCGEEWVTVKGSFSDLAKTLNLGRASLYRAIDQLEEKGTIRREGKTIFLRNEGTESL